MKKITYRWGYRRIEHDCVTVRLYRDFDRFKYLSEKS